MTPNSTRSRYPPINPTFKSSPLTSKSNHTSPLPQLSTAHSTSSPQSSSIFPSNASSPDPSRSYHLSSNNRLQSLHQAHQQLSDQIPPPSPPAYAIELARAQDVHRIPMSRESSLPSIMSMPHTRPASPEPSTSSAHYSHPHQQQQQPRHIRNVSVPPHRLFNVALLAGGAGHLPSSLRTFEEGIRHYERVRSPSLRGHSRRGSFSTDSIGPKSSSPARGVNRVLQQLPPSPRSPLCISQIQHQSPAEQLGNATGGHKLEVSTSEMYDFDLSDDSIVEMKKKMKKDSITYSRHSLSDDDDDAYDDEDEEDGFNSGSDPKHLTRSNRIFRVGERVGVGTSHQSHRVRDLFELGPGNGRRLSMGGENTGQGTGLLEIVRQIGCCGLPTLHPSSLPDGLSETPKASDGFATLMSPVTSSQPPRRRRRRRGETDEVVYGRDFALKCLSKRDLSDELLLLQRGEAEIHRALPSHENIVALHRALETPNWLFLVIEYCPGQDLFYWLEQARDSQDLDSLASRTNSVSQQLCPPQYTNGAYTTPPTSFAPSNNPSKTSPIPFPSPSSPPLSPDPSDDEMLSRRRLRLISRMFVQMCDAVEACHRVGVCHRDIKPENFIVVDSRRSKSKSLASNSRPISFATNHQFQPRSTDEIRPPSSVVVKITDWGLGTSSSACEDFDCGSKPYMAYECRNNLNPTYDPVQADVWSLGIVLLNLLYHRCPWADPTLADGDFVEFRRAPIAFLHDRFEGMTSEVAAFLATRVFCEAGSQGAKKRISAGQFGEWAKNLLFHMGGGTLHASVSSATIAMSPSSARGSSHFGFDHRSASGSRNVTNSDHDFPLESTKSSGTHTNPSTVEIVDPKADPKELLSSSPINKASDSPDLYLEGDLVQDKLEKLKICTSPPATTTTADEVESVGSAGGGKMSDKRRRKRGARKGGKSQSHKTDGMRQIGSGSENTPISPNDSDQDELDDLAEASQSLAREISQATRSPCLSTSAKSSAVPVKRKLNLAERMMEKFRDGSNPDWVAFAARAKARENALYGIGPDGNAGPVGNTVSAPAQLQCDGGGKGGRAYSSSKMHGTYSTPNASNNVYGALGGRGVPSGLGGCKQQRPTTSDSSPGVWTSASVRRGRLQQQQQAAASNVKKPNTDPPRAMYHSNSRPDRNHNGKKNLVSNDLNHQNLIHDSLSSNKKSNEDFGVDHITSTTTNRVQPPKTKLAALLTSFKRFNQTVVNAGSGNGL
ncbi:serine/threonine protein kinase, variant [Melampsora americana]|nr:serine/threonine protein kinase, variant [Melampsora americana]